MEGENFPYFFVPSSFPSNDSASNSNNNYSNVVSQSMQNPQMFPAASDLQIDLGSLFSAAGSVLDQNLQMNSSAVSGNNNIIREVEINNVSCRSNKPKFGRKKKYVPPRVAFHTRSTEDILDDGYKWRKYGQKSVKNSDHPRSYYRCTHHTCNVKKQIQRLSKDTSIVVTTYEGIHNHPCEKLMETLSPLLKQLQFLSRF